MEPEEEQEPEYANVLIGFFNIFDPILISLFKRFKYSPDNANRLKSSYRLFVVSALQNRNPQWNAVGEGGQSQGRRTGQ